ncbi:alpha/beta hydrolase [Pelagibacterium halotolerans]|uniref:Endo-1,4-beta-xylanase Z n=1 Tax=Pelagibacterium halotolerans (strain DSM 22347 / JCM 15775 / CGMCC 1.7692 / B2) TaxID=1082931 RepID=G4RFW9_PELHB|nr:alpha/beta hydrolase-fold protein [Pelagibacterium halotolerans]AEQ51012.1 endo-1,4-beta-xylanase Z precursor [Pelagibacterium halotolerans B2]QJR19097.1 esterase family protein [Pelagibacterium halotolerans]SEA02492.1 Enterochelin esterase [Pelagibacterium halotolerans]
MNAIFRLTLCASATLVLATPVLGQSVQRLTFESEALGRAFPYTVYLPAGYEDGDLDYSVLYLLHGANGNEQNWVTSGKVVPTLNALIADGEIPPVVVVMPGGGNNWWADGNDEPMQTAFFDDLIPHVEDQYNVITERSGRMIAGLSAGGFGTTNFVLQYPDMFVSAAALSPAVYDPTPPSHSSAHRSVVFQTDGAFDQEVWDSLNWPSFIEGYLEQDTVVPLYINSGDHDTFDIAYHAAVLYQRLREHQPTNVEYRVVDGDHEWSVWADTIGDAVSYMTGYASWPRARDAEVN